ncbi:elongation factor 1-gamma [Pseudohyphozyma bogoriensis]|nr:elongation factor 1-gamma [Pseudohyphozyma bogoriensis]
MAFGKLYYYAGNPRARVSLVAAAFEGLELESVPTDPFAEGGAPAAYLAKFPNGLIPGFEKDDFLLSESVAIATVSSNGLDFCALASFNNKAGLIGATKEEAASVQQWMSWANTNLLPAIGNWFKPMLGKAPYNKPAVEAAKAKVVQNLTILNNYLADKTFLVGHRVTLADIFVASALQRGTEVIIDAALFAQFPNALRFLNTVVNQPTYLSVIGSAPVWLQEPVVYTPPKKEEKPKKEKAAPAPKAEKPAKKEVEEEEPAAPAEPKAKHPAELLGPAKSFPLDEFKRQYSNNDTPVAVKWLADNFNEQAAQEYSFFKAVYKYPTELTQVFMSSNLITGFHTRLEGSRKYLFGSAGVYGTSNNSQIAGAYMVRGSDFESIFNVAPDYESYEFTPLDFVKDREFIEGCWAWTNTFEGLEYADGKVFKLLSSTLVVALASFLATTVDASPVLAPRADPSAVVSCLVSNGLSPITASSSSYGPATAAFNQRVQPSPLAVVRPTTPGNVRKAVNCARGRGVPVSALGGRHSYASYGFGGTDGASLVLDMSAFQGVWVYSNGTAKVGAGARLGDIALELGNKGRALPHGVCPFVGIGGHASFGGFGISSRMWGLTIDRIIGLDVVLSNGTIVTNLNAKKDSNLFWAMRGAGPDFGVITAFYFKTLAAPSVVINFKYTWYHWSFTPAQAADLFLKYQTFVSFTHGRLHAPPELGITFTVSPSYSKIVEISGAYHGTMDDFHYTMVAFVESFPTGYERVVSQNSWLGNLQLLAGSQSLDTRNSGQSDYRDDFYVKSLMTPSDYPLTKAAMESFFRYVFGASTTTKWFVEVNLYGGAGSAINAVSTSTNSFGGRGRLLNFQIYASSPTYGPPYPQEGITFVKGVYNSIQQPMAAVWNSHTKPSAYVNYVDPLLTAAEVRDQYWGSQYPRLAQLRGVYDPQKVFSNPQSIVAA